MANRRSSDDGGKELQTWEQVFLALLGDLLTFLLHATRSNPADPEAAGSLRRMIALWLKLQAKAGVKDTPLTDPHGLLGTNADKPEG